MGQMSYDCRIKVKPLKCGEDVADDVSVLRDVTAGLVADLQDKHKSIRVIRNGVLQITLFRPNDFKYAKLIVDFKGVYLVMRPTAEHSEANFRGPFPLEDPEMFNHLYSAIEQWIKSNG